MIAGLVAVVILLVADVNIYISRGRVQERLSGSPRTHVEIILKKARRNKKIEQLVCVRFLRT